MKIIISHDVDHITAWEHKKDLIIPKFLARSSIELVNRGITGKEYLLRLKDIINNKWQNIRELMEFDKQNGIPSTFFVGVSNGLGLSYPLEIAKLWVKNVLKEGFDVGVHGIAYNEFNEMKKEFEIFKQISGQKKFGIRMHYLRNDRSTLKLLSKIGYYFDSTLYELDNPYKIGYLWEFPLHIMDGYIIMEEGKKWQTKNINKIMEDTKRTIERASKNNIKYLTILFHDRYFSRSFNSWRKWYIYTVEYLKRNNMEFISYRDAIKKLETL
jgi:peptidoglycan/xylan/chitin deacetylase (PgdA/CDA1 family)